MSANQLINEKSPIFYSNPKSGELLSMSDEASPGVGPDKRFLYPSDTPLPWCHVMGKNSLE
jgi:hypothetical protein